jgi:hypothetical protein
MAIAVYTGVGGATCIAKTLCFSYCCSPLFPSLPAAAR